MRPQRPTSPDVGPVISLVIDAWIWAWVRATLQMRTSSSAPLKNPAATLVEFRAVAKETATLLAAATGWPTALWFSSRPSRYKRQVVPS